MVPAARLLPILAPLAGGAAVLVWRFRETRTPVTTRKIVLPPLGMATGFFMFLAPEQRIPWSWALTSFAAGALLLAVPLMRSSTLERDGAVVVMRRSHGFLGILLGLLALRLLLHEYVGHLVSARQTASVFFVLAFGMILRWRASMYVRFRTLREAEVQRPSGVPYG